MSLATLAFIVLTVLLPTQRAHSSCMMYDSSDDLLAFRSWIPQNNRISPLLMHRKKTLGINKVPATKKGVRAGRTNDRPGKEPRQSQSILHGETHNYDSQLNFAMLNARSVTNKTSGVIDFVLDNDLDVLGICETWLPEDYHAAIGELTSAAYSFTHKSELKVQVSPFRVRYQSFEFIEGNIISDSKSIQVAIIVHQALHPH